MLKISQKNSFVKLDVFSRQNGSFNLLPKEGTHLATPEAGTEGPVMMLIIPGIHGV